MNRDAQSRRELTAFLTANPHLSQGRIAHSLGISGSTLSAWMNGKYAGDNGKITEAVRSLLEREAEKTKRKKVTLVFTHTTASRKLFDIAKLCHLDGEIGVVCADAGIGKTSAVREYARIKKDVLLIEVDPGDSPQAFFTKLNGSIGVRTGIHVNTMFADACEVLKDTGRLLIVDEAEHLQYRALELLRRLHDHTGIGILLVGMPRLYANLRGRRGEYEQLYSRVGVYARLEPVTLKDFEAVLDVVLPGLNGCVRVFYELCDGRMRRLDKLTRRAMRVAEMNNAVVNEDIVRTAAESLIF